MDAKLNVGNLATTTTTNDLEALFSQAGTVVMVRLLDPSASAARSAQVTMVNHAAAQKAIDLFHEAELAGRRLVVALAPARPATAGQSGQLSAFGLPKRGTPGQTRGGFNSTLGAFGGGKSGPSAPRRRGGGQHR